MRLAAPATHAGSLSHATPMRPVAHARVVAMRSSSPQGQHADTSSSGLHAEPAPASPSPAAASTTDDPLSRLAKPAKRQAESTDAIASFLTRRFGLAGGLAWLGFLAVGSLGEQVKTRWEVASEEQGARDVGTSELKEVVLPSGVRYTDLRIGGGQSPPKGYLVVVNFVGRANGQVFADTYAAGAKPIVYFYGARPFTGGLCLGTEEALATMKAGGKRRVVVPAAMGFGSAGTVLRPTLHMPDKQGIVPPDADLEYDLELVRVSIPPS